MMYRHLGLAALSFAALGVLACDDDETNPSEGGGGEGAGSTTTATTATTSSTASTTSSSQSTGAGEPGSVEASWSIMVQGELRDCFFAGASYVDLAIEDADGSVDTVRANCDEPEGLTQALAAGTYTVTPSLVSFAEDTVFTAPATEVVVMPSVTAGLPIVFEMPGAHLHATWSIFQDGVAATCEEVGAHRAEIVATRADGLTYGNTFDCPLGEGTTDAFPLGTYEVVVSLLYEQDVVLVSSDFLDATLDEAGETVDLPPVDFDFQTPPTP
ncbi:MAG: hypothetical protein HOV80_38495 [Polyangiaceae bacterium]|nr:hypothetical protein [Polyangiaceae bacterium]